MHFKKSIIVASLLVATSAFAQSTQVYQGHLNIGIDVLPPSYTADQAQWLADQGCDYQNTYVPMYNTWAKQTETDLNNTYSSQYMGNYIDKAPNMDINSCLSGPLGQLSGLASSFSKVYGILSGDVNAGQAMDFAKQQLTSQACSMISNYGNQTLNGTPLNTVGNMAGQITNPGNAIGGQTGSLINGIVNSATQNPGNNGGALNLVGAGGNGSGNALSNMLGISNGNTGNNGGVIKY